MIVNQVIPGQEDGNARLIEELGIGTVADGKKEVARWVERLVEGDLWCQWRARLDKISRPDAAMRIAQLILDECDRANHCSRPEKFPAAGRSEEHTSELQSHSDLVCRLLLEKKKNIHHME